MKKRLIVGFIVIVLFLALEGSGILSRRTLRTLGILLPERSAKQESMEQLALLTRIADLTREHTAKTILTKVILGGGFLFSDTLVVRAGTDEGVLPGDLAIAYGTVIGRVDTTSSHESSIVPFSRFAEKITIRLGQKKDITLEGEGIGGGEIRIELLRGLGIATGNSAWWGERSEYLVGLISHVDTQEGRSMDHAYITNPFSLKSLSEITLVRP